MLSAALLAQTGRRLDDPQPHDGGIRFRVSQGRFRDDAPDPAMSDTTVKRTIMSRGITTILVLAGLASGLVACGQSTGDRAVSGGLIGAGAGAAVGAVSGGSVGGGALIGGAVGAVGGAATSSRDVNLGRPVWR
ncbi:hypothetical protein [Limobrevibacterium gyesilva]|uniref:Glycine zipper domain-containing protein n=1 Tax=Limobrevibacterium gyesilva TaxID=2991712 RepID=A0AA41YR60_9PROT|nr:hypothetical protein [Limobrevibacterium gyesilva]MCW3474985.1 hypothetical protein [Limobrevibacterium gyesilva]